VTAGCHRCHQVVAPGYEGSLASAVPVAAGAVRVLCDLGDMWLRPGPPICCWLSRHLACPHATAACPVIQYGSLWQQCLGRAGGKSLQAPARGWCAAVQCTVGLGVVVRPGCWVWQGGACASLPRCSSSSRGRSFSDRLVALGDILHAFVGAVHHTTTPLHLGAMGADLGRDITHLLVPAISHWCPWRGSKQLQWSLLTLWLLLIVLQQAAAALHNLEHSKGASAWPLAAGCLVRCRVVGDLLPAGPALVPGEVVGYARVVVLGVLCLLAATCCAACGVGRLGPLQQPTATASHVVLQRLAARLLAAYRTWPAGGWAVVWLVMGTSAGAACSGDSLQGPSHGLCCCRLRTVCSCTTRYGPGLVRLLLPHTLVQDVKGLLTGRWDTAGQSCLLFTAGAGEWSALQAACLPVGGCKQPLCTARWRW
jgi:hypothetical protein